MDVRELEEAITDFGFEPHWQASLVGVEVYVFPSSSISNLDLFALAWVQFMIEADLSVTLGNILDDGIVTVVTILLAPPPECTAQLN